jgi:predicted DNA binding protein
MRELVVTLSYDRGVDPVTDVFVDESGLVASSVDVSVTESGLARVDRLSGPPGAMEALGEVYLDPERCTECTAPTDRCDAERSYEVVDDGRGGRTVYTFHADVSFCDSVPFHARHRLPPGTLFASRRRGNSHEWRVLMRSDRAVGDLYDALVDGLPGGVTVSFERLGSPERWGERTGTVADLPPAQRAAIETAVAMDYYETPRGATLADLSAALDVPQSTLRYRLRRAEAWLARTHVGEGPTAGAAPGDGETSPAD